MRAGDANAATALNETRKNSPTDGAGSTGTPIVSSDRQAVFEEMRERVAEVAASVDQIAAVFDRLAACEFVVAEGPTALSVAFTGMTVTDMADMALPSDESPADDDNEGHATEVFVLDIGGADVRLHTSGSTMDLDLSNGRHAEVIFLDSETFQDTKLSSTWKDDSLVLTLPGDTTLVLENAASAGSLILRSGETLLNLTPQAGAPERPQMLDVSL